MTGNPSYALLMLTGLLVSAWLWSRVARPRVELTLVYVGGFIGAMLGAKLVFLLAEMPFHFADADWGRQLLYGKTITGGLLGGYAGVEFGKRIIGHRQPTGDGFAVMVPTGLFFGRLGCALHGCCPGVACVASWYTVSDSVGLQRWPAPLVEAAFNLAIAPLMYAAFRRGVLKGQLFHVYLIAYGLFRLVHEPWRDTPRLADTISSYQLVAIALIAFGGWRFWRRMGPTSADETPAALAPLRDHLSPHNQNAGGAACVVNQTALRASSGKARA